MTTPNATLVVALKLLTRAHDALRWRAVLDEDPPKDGTHIIACTGPYSPHWGFNQSPPMVLHYWSNPGEEGFYLSHGLVEGSYNDSPRSFTHWRPLGDPP